MQFDKTTLFAVDSNLARFVLLSNHILKAYQKLLLIQSFCFLKKILTPIPKETDLTYPLTLQDQKM